MIEDEEAFVIVERRVVVSEARIVPHPVERLHVLAEGTDYREPGANYYDRRQTARTTRRAVAQLERLGYRVTLEPAA